MTRATLGRLEPVELRNIWTSEAADFTPWLARPENLSVLGETLGIDLELEAQERSVGPFRADIQVRLRRHATGVGRGQPRYVVLSELSNHPLVAQERRVAGSPQREVRPR